MFLIDYSSLLIAIGFTGSALALTLFTTWLTTRSESFLLTWAIGAVLVVVGAVTFGLYSDRYNVIWLAVTSFIVLAYGLATFFGAAWQFRHRRQPWRRVLFTGFAATLVIGLPFGVGYSGLGAGIANLVMASLLMATAREYWLCRQDAPTPLIILVFLHSVVAATFILCSGFILVQTPLVLERAPQNWAEDLNALVSLLAISGIGAIALALNQSRLALQHRAESLTDVLTGLVNRRALFDTYGNSRVPERTSVIVFDLDRFKAVNDDFGHAVGDQVLRSFTQVLQASLRPTDTAVRMGGEEFVLVLPGCPAESARTVGERVRIRFSEQSIETDSGILRCTVSAGIASTDAGDEELDVILKRADDALYAAKREGGRNCVRVYNTI